MAGDQKNVRSPLLVEFPREFRSGEEFFAVISQIAKIPGTPFRTKIPSAAEIRAGKTDVVLVGEDMRIEVRSGSTPLSVTRRRVSFGVGNLAAHDWWITFDKFPHLKVKLYKHRGRPRKDLLRAQIRGESAEGKNLSELGRRFGLSRAATGHYRLRGETRRGIDGGFR